MDTKFNDFIIETLDTYNNTILLLTNKLKHKNYSQDHLTSLLITNTWHLFNNIEFNSERGKELYDEMIYPHFGDLVMEISTIGFQDQDSKRIGYLERIERRPICVSSLSIDEAWVQADNLLKEITEFKTVTIIRSLTNCFDTIE